MDIVHVIEVKVCIPEDDQPKPIESLVASVKRLQIEAEILESTLAAINENLVDSYCGRKYSRHTPEERYIRAGTSEKRIITSVGSITLKLNKVRDVQENRIWKPLTEVVQFGKTDVSAGDLHDQRRFRPETQLSRYHRRVRDCGSRSTFADDHK